MKQTGNFGQAVELFQNFLIQPYKNRQNPFYKKIQERFTQIRSTFGIPDWIIMTVNIGRNNRRCEFSVELLHIAVYCFAGVNLAPVCIFTIQEKNDEK